MSHFRARYILPLLKQYGSFWPVVGLLGMRQSGKSTLLRDFLKVGTYVTLDDVDALQDARASSKIFLQKLPRPLVIDEVQRAPLLFDSIKFEVDGTRVPGRFYLTGSSQFSSRIGIRESLTGRIGLLYLYPLTLGEAHGKPLETKRVRPLHHEAARFPIADVLSALESGNLPIPLFTRKPALARNYFQSWVETTLLRDTQRAYGKGYDPDIAYSLVDQMKIALKNGEYPTLKHFAQDSRKVRRYLQAFEDIFLLHKLCPARMAVGSDLWAFADSGIAAYTCGTILGEGTHLSLIRTWVLKEVRALSEYCEKRLRLEYYKTARSHPVDFLWDGVPVKISTSAASSVEYDLRCLRSAMRAMKSKAGVLMWGRDSAEHEDGIRMVPWTHFS